MKVLEIRELLVKDPTIVSEDELITNVIKDIIANPISRHAYVVDSEKRIVGSIKINSIINYLFPFESFWKNEDHTNYLNMFDIEKASEIMVKDFHSVKDDSPLTEMVEIMLKEKINELPVVDNENHIIGEVNIMELLKFITQEKKMLDNI
jgi:Mg/Co/Ni transporter MgtE